MHLLFSSAGAVSEAELGNHVTYTPTKTATGTVATQQHTSLLLWDAFTLVVPCCW